MSCDGNFSCETAVHSLREKGYVLVESTITVYKNEIEYNINSFTITLRCGGYIKIYDRSQYAHDSPRVGVFVEARGMCYGDHSGNFRVSCLDDILKHVE